MLKLEEIKVGGFNVRDRYLEEGVAELTASIREHGVCVPILVRAEGDGYEVLDGGRRVYCAGKLGLVEVPGVVCEGGEVEARSLAWVLNFQREAVSFVDEAGWLSRVVGEAGVSVDEVGVLLGRSTAYVRSRLAVLEWPSALVVYCQSACVSFSVAREFARLGDSPELERALDWDRVNQASYRQAAAYVDAILLARDTVVPPEVVREASKPVVPVCGACGAEVDWGSARNLLVCGDCQVAIGLVPEAASAEGGVVGLKERSTERG